MFARPGLCGMGIGRLGLVAASQPSLVAQALAILARYGGAANLYLPGVGAINGITAGNWLDSAGTTTATVDNPVGLVVSAGKAVGPELITVNSVTGLPSGGGARYYGLTSAMPSVVVGKTYRVSYTVSGYSGSGNVGIAGTNSFSQLNNTGNGSYQSVHTPNGTAGLFFYTSDTNTCNFSNISVRELTGAHLTQSTAANRPILRQSGGVYAWDFVSADSFTSTLGTGNEGWVCTSVRPAVLANQVLITNGANLPAQPGISLKSRANGEVWFNRSNGSAIDVFVFGGPSSLVVGVAKVVDAAWTETSAVGVVNGVEVTRNTNMSAASSVPLRISGTIDAAPSELFNGYIGDTIIMPTVLPTASERSILRKLIASLSGVTL